jgi:hypothetical protein
MLVELSVVEHRYQAVLAVILFSVTNAYAGELVDVFVDATTIQVWSKNRLIRTVARAREGRVRKVRADGLHVKGQPTTNRQASTGT